MFGSTFVNKQTAMFRLTLLVSYVPVLLAQISGDVNVQKFGLSADKSKESNSEDLPHGESPSKNEHFKKNVVKDIRIFCNPHDITLDITTVNNYFNGMIYPKGLTKNSSCMMEYIELEGIVTYKIPLHSCNTMNIDVNTGVEYFNTIVVQPHRKLVTNQGRGYHIRCRYQTQERILRTKSKSNSLDTTASPLISTTTMPGTHMKIYLGEPSEGTVAESVRIGDMLTLVVSIDDQEIYGMQVTECLVRDGLGWSEQLLINEDGCPVDYDIMGPFEYSIGKTTAYVNFHAHKFPYAPSVYYQCNVRLCIRHAGGCDNVPPVCNLQGENTIKTRRKRQTFTSEDSDAASYDFGEEEVNVEVHSSHFVRTKAEDIQETRSDNTPQRVHHPDKICFPQKDFAIVIAIIGLILIMVVIVAVMILLSKRRRRKDLSTTGSSIYSGPYTNTAYSNSS